MTGRLYHGGAPGRRRGDLLLPPSKTGLTRTTRTESVRAGFGNVTQRNDRVYVTTDRELAHACAGVWTADGVSVGGGVLYRVQAFGDLEPDEDLPGLGISFQLPGAVVLAVIDAYVRRDDARYGATLRSVLSRLS